MQTIERQTIIGLVLTILYCCNATAQTPVYYQYDAAGNRNLRTITLFTSMAKSAKIDSVANKQKEVFQDNLGDKKILIYPNPTQGQLKVDIEGYQEEPNSGLYLYNLSGNLITSKSPANSSTVLDLSPYPVGSYILKIIIGDKKTEWKIIKE